MPRRVLILVLVAGVGLVAWAGVLVARDKHFQSELREAKRELSRQRLDRAKERLSELAQRWPGRGDVEYWLGTCEMAAGNADAALEAWSRVPAKAPEAGLAVLASGRLAMDKFRYSVAERCLERAILEAGETGEEARWLLARLHWLTGRHDEYRRFLRREVERARSPWENLRLLWTIDHEGYPVEGISQEIDQARRAAPEDDRVWLGLADLATRTGRFEEAAAYLARCERARPGDLAVWQARLEWGRVAGRADEVARAAEHLSASAVSGSRVLALRAWMAARCGERVAERKALEELVSLESGDSAAIERLAALAAQDGQKERAAELRRRKAAIDAATDRYRALISQPELPSHATQLARNAEQIGRRFDARAWWMLAAHRDPTIEQDAAAALARLSKPEAEIGATGGTLADLLDLCGSLKNKRIAGFQPPTTPTFSDEAQSRGLAITFDNGRTKECQLPETMSGGVALLDFDGDGWLDVYAIQGEKFPPPPGPVPFGDRLFRNRGDGRFVDVTDSSGLAKLPGGYGHGVAVGDYDNDGRPDLFITRWRSYALYHNVGGGRFEDATATAGLGGDRDWPTSAAWADLDNDGDLDLYVCHYARWDELHPTLCPARGQKGAPYDYCDPRGLPALPDHVFRNDGGRFVDVTAEAGVVDHEGKGLGVVAADLDDDGKIDLFVANDMTDNYFFRNQGGFRFSEEGLVSGLAASAAGGNLAGMGVACADFDGDGRLDLAVTNFMDQSTTLYHNHGAGVFSDRSTEAGLAAPTRLVLGFGLAALDANDDGWPDLVQANGHVSDHRPRFPYHMPAQLFLNLGQGHLIDVSDRSGAPWKVPRIARGLAVGDIDNDGRTDVLIVSENDPLALLHNQSASPNQSLTLLLEGTASNRDAVGARVAVTAAGKTQVATRFGGGSYLSASDHRLHFGLGAAKKADRVEVTWPSGRRDCYEGLAADAGYRLREGGPAPEPLTGFTAGAHRTTN
jgi:thioredoxin-like negative regulator of GroEL